MTSIPADRRTATPGTANARALPLAGAAVAASAINMLIAQGAFAFGADESFHPLTPAVFIPFTVLGVVAGFLGWRAINRRSKRPARTLLRLVPLVLLLSLVPDLVVMVTKAIPDTSTVGVLGLMLMHVSVAAVSIPVYQWIDPARGARSDA